MTLVEDARRMVGEWPSRNAEVDGCPFCHHFGHEDDCPWLAMPRILAALEAAEQIKTAMQGKAPHYGYYEARCFLCDQLIPTEGGNEPGHAPECPWQALVAALRGEGVAA